jgi:hypothetical protein
MKKVVLSFFVVCVVILCNAQRVKLNVTQGQKLSANTTTIINTSTEAFGQIMESKVSLNSNINAVFSNTSHTELELTLTLSKLKSTISMMGQEMNYDSEKKDNEEEMEKALSKNINKPNIIKLDKNANEIADESKAKINLDKDAGTIEELIGNYNSVTSKIFILPSIYNVELKENNSWTDSSESKSNNLNNKNIFVYTIKKIETDLISIEKVGNTSTYGTITQQGTEMQITGTTTYSGEIVIDKSTGLIKKETTTSTIKQNAEIIGSTIQVTGKTTTTTIIN